MAATWRPAARDDALGALEHPDGPPLFNTAAQRGVADSLVPTTDSRDVPAPTPACLPIVTKNPRQQDDEDIQVVANLVEDQPPRRPGRLRTRRSPLPDTPVPACR